MKNTKKNRTRILIIFGFGVGLLGLQGCDKLSSTFAALKKDKTKETAAPVAVKASGEQAQNVAAAPVAAGESKNVLAKVGSWVLTKEDFQERLAALKELVPDYNTKDVGQNKLILEELVRQQLLVQDAEGKGLAASKDVVQAVEEFRRTILVREVATKIAQGVSVTEQEAQDYYTQNKSEFVAPGQWRLREIVVDPEQQAKDILVELLKGADFAETAKQKSKGKTASAGGDLGLVSTFEFPQMEKTVVALSVGDVSSVFTGPQGFYIVKLEEKKGGEQKEFEEIKNDIKEGLTMLKQQQAILDYIEQLRQKTPVYVNDKLLEE
jgi:peptidyl-prolyl cis-trans isomerase C